MAANAPLLRLDWLTLVCPGVLYPPSCVATFGKDRWNPFPLPTARVDPPEATRVNNPIPSPPYVPRLCRSVATAAARADSSFSSMRAKFRGV